MSVPRKPRSPAKPERQLTAQQQAEAVRLTAKRAEGSAGKSQAELKLTPEQEVEARRLAELVQTAAAEELVAIARLLVSKPDRQIFGATEFQIRDMVHKIGAKAFELELAERKKKTAYQGCSINCPGCDESADFHAWRPKTLEAVMHRVTFDRPYYYCDHCKSGCFPWDSELGLGRRRLTPGAEEVVAMAGLLTGFGEASEKVLPKLAGMHPGESTVQRTTEDAGRRLEKLLKQGVVFGPAEDWEWNTDAHGDTCAYVSIDLTGVGMQGPGGAKAEGRMEYVGMVYNPKPKADTDTDRLEDTTYLAGFYDLEELGRQMRRQAARVGMDRADRWIELTDGGSGLENFMNVNFPGAKQTIILDIYHPFSKLEELTKAMFPQDRERSQKQAERWCHILKHKGGAAMLKTLAGWDMTGYGETARELHRTLTGYITNNLHRMDYPTYRANGWQIGSGPVESACKTLIGRRMKCGGMRWGEHGADTVGHLRAMFRNDPEEWDAFWSHRPTPVAKATATNN